MLDGILGRGFSVKCKSLIKTIRARIDVVRRRVEAKQRFLREDLAKLLSNGLDINAYGRTEEYLAGLNLLCLYDVVEQYCECIVKQLSRMQKQGECPEECREAVASLIYAAARFSDLPELRELRDTFQQRYGHCLEVFVNQKFVENLSSRPPSNEKRLQVLQDIASEFSIKWHSSGFQRRLAATHSVVIQQVDVQKADIVKQSSRILDEKRIIHSYGETNVSRKDEDESNHHIIKRNETTDYREKSVLKRGGGSRLQGDDGIKHSYPADKGGAQLKVESRNRAFHEKVLDNNVDTGSTTRSNRSCNPRKGESTEYPGKTENVISYNCSNQDNAMNSISKRLDEGSDRFKSCASYTIPPPPYVRSKDDIPCPPYTKPKEDKDRHTRSSKHAGFDMDEDDTGNTKTEKNVAPTKVKNYDRGKEVDYQIPLPKPRSIQRKHHKSSSNYIVEDVGGVNRSSSSRRKDRSRKDDEERMMDKMLIHYSKKQSSYDEVKLRNKLSAKPSHVRTSDDGESSISQSRDADYRELGLFPPPSRSVSLPTALPESEKVLSRANTFQADNQAPHVHPKLPDYDDLAARFAALKGT
ncbi:hypothetical protein ABFS82_10G110000 [Erythranthe guttata]|uniref:IST1-like protein n=1 Tax=Erythranthe guttata TaxID=4155 RepID=A0A022PRX4_ERYGU|nr:PREDICTED: uncharacterized protein LOC105949849 [Erythranthe guttata]EYU18264.1 hypothetical protein MIMGU_mgv1a003486mg [Erythranthe guttata]|eukprot:XP_012828613.1 PREDICTED: uncharacterized protein LOC105949849 [Erythranthe guttata]